jgi:RNA polymerase sigma-70 factor, ECF subfamily
MAMTDDRLRQGADALNQGVARRVEGGQAAAFQAILSAAARGDEDAFAALWRNLQPALLHYLHTIAPDAAEDIAAETWIEVIRGLQAFHGDEPTFRTWALTIARKRVIDWRQRSDNLATQPQRTDTSDRPHAIADALSSRAALALIATLPPDQAEIVALRVLGGLNVAEVATVTGKRPGTVRVLAHRGLRRLAKQFEIMESKRQATE